mmetsp:Transcript_32573/g.56765  ORF Transcript_32573/g.56765 Transcript_32573/m.56765 type:complete len:225 (+) Transcript_32573:805-1479(+)
MSKSFVKGIVFALPQSTLWELLEIFVNPPLQLKDSLDAQFFGILFLVNLLFEQGTGHFTSHPTSTIHQHILPPQHLLRLLPIQPQRKLGRLPHLRINHLRPPLRRIKPPNIRLVMIPHINNDRILLAHLLMIILRLQMRTPVLGKRGRTTPRKTVIHQFRHLEGMQFGKPLLGRQVVRQFELRVGEFRGGVARERIDLGSATVELAECGTPCAYAIVGAGECAV